MPPYFLSTVGGLATLPGRFERDTTLIIGSVDAAELTQIKERSHGRRVGNDDE